MLQVIGSGQVGTCLGDAGGPIWQKIRYAVSKKDSEP